ncbi:hypothetical protein [Apilactobacillus micheneri]|uniref:hypothetical protein n=1 Tax=Apilactobacillus micheneri TaxID=1899430 RepID=UPI000D034832|nr:hypothetical protein [Apilactobacillus micheneri]TPR37979.1 hypothetical protein DY116_01800 [Apilactobacillus micheneri]
MQQLRIYTLKDEQSAREYLSTHWNRHLESLPKFGINVDKVFMEENSSTNCRVFALVSSDGDNLSELNAEYMNSEAFKSDMIGFDMSKILKVEDIDITKYI